MTTKNAKYNADGSEKLLNFLAGSVADTFFLSFSERGPHQAKVTFGSRDEPGLLTVEILTVDWDSPVDALIAEAIEQNRKGELLFLHYETTSEAQNLKMAVVKTIRRSKPNAQIVVL